MIYIIITGCGKTDGRHDITPTSLMSLKVTEAMMISAGKWYVDLIIISSYH